MTTANPAQPASRLDAAIAAGAYEVVALPLALGVLTATATVRAEAADTREDLLALMADLASPLDPTPGGPQMSCRSRTRDASVPFYERALTAAERSDFAQAREVRGLADEAALLRMLLRDALQRQPKDLDQLLSAVRLLANVLLAQHRISGRQAEDLISSLAST